MARKKKEPPGKQPLPEKSEQAGVFESFYVAAKNMKSAMESAWKDRGKQNYFMASRVGRGEKLETWRFDYYDGN